MVLVYHSYAVRSEPPLLEFLSRGVDLFFVLSGFLISGLLFSEYKASGNINCWRFWIRRGFKIYPAFYTLMAVTSVLIIRAHLQRSLLWNEVFFVQNYRPHFWTHTWSLGVEEHFYIALPLVLLLLIRLQPESRNPFKSVPIVSIALSIVCLFLRIRAAIAGKGIEQVAFPTHLRIDALFAGVALGYFYHFNRPSFEDAKKAWVPVVGMLMFLACVPLPYLPQLTFAYAAFVLIVAWTVNQPTEKFRYLSPIAWLGRYSYSVYLWHLVAFLLIQRFVPQYGSLLTFVVGSVLLGVVMATIIEMPFLRLRDKLIPSSPGTQSRTKPTCELAEIR